ncbi:partial Ribonuclease VapC49, partial [Anaerolineae bacterium]
SAFAKRYVQEDGSEEALLWCDRATELALAVTALPEMISAFCRLRRENRITDGQYLQLKSALFQDVEDIALCDLTPEVIQNAVRCLEAHVLRGMDAIHVGCALAWRAEVFISSDRRQCTAAQAAGLRVIEL